MEAAKNLSHLNVVPEMTEVDLPKATFGIRFVALLIDGIVIQVLTGVLLALFGATADGKPTMGKFLLTFTFQLTLLLFPTYAFGQTLGKKVMKIKVISAEAGEKHLGIWQCIVREVFGKLMELPRERRS